jgi:acyl dehydratase
MTTREDRYFEDYVVGVAESLGTVTIGAPDIVEFARRYDPQPFHVDEQAARESIYGGLIASGWQTASLMMRCFADGYLSQASSLGSPGIDGVRWLAPVRPGDSLSVTATPIEANPSRSKPDRGLVRTRIDVTNQDGNTVMTMTAMNLILRRGH